MPRPKSNPKAKSPSGDPTKIEASLVATMSLSELVTIARTGGMVNASRATPREKLEQFLMGTTVEAEPDILEGIRQRTSDYVSNNLRIMRSLLSCDLVCATCPHAKVIECYSENHDLVDKVVN